MVKEIEIPEGYEAKIEDNKVIFVQKESEDERIRKWILEKMQGYASSGIPCSDEIKMADKAIDYLEKQKEQKQEWSDEDKRILKGIIGLVDHNQHYNVSNKEMLAWLKSLRPVSKEFLQPHWKPSKQEIDAFETALKGEFQNGVYPTVRLCELFQKLKKLYYNGKIPQWKPSEEQMKAFKGYIKDFQERAEAAVGGWNNFDVMIRLYEQLKKLM